ncbi:hypothetical protein BDV98DRAFT_572321 [Pterulicium gracile]|uniref:IPT/TIG domain-containing protein n=1 Tax=Pterulicium gracile TaxID=1884261 RepID=A0A5C3QKG3_9AGAR|nr:hypothetical protein BDV98DRAFT_572321 [Pterula gracilis]
MAGSSIRLLSTLAALTSASRFPIPPAPVSLPTPGSLNSRPGAISRPALDSGLPPPPVPGLALSAPVPCLPPPLPLASTGWPLLLPGLPATPLIRCGARMTVSGTGLVRPGSTCGWGACWKGVSCWDEAWWDEDDEDVGRAWG